MQFVDIGAVFKQSRVVREDVEAGFVMIEVVEPLDDRDGVQAIAHALGMQD